MSEIPGERVATTAFAPLPALPASLPLPSGVLDGTDAW
jgi:hypothetical protein